MNVLLLTTETDFLSHPPEHIIRDCIKTQIKVSSLILSGTIIIGIMLFENDHTYSSKKYGNEVVNRFNIAVIYDTLLYSSLFACLRLLLSYL